MTEDVEITTIRTDRVYSDEQVEQWNAEYDLFLIPLANAFRITFMAELRILTDLVKRMKIPCVVVGVGMARKVNSRKWKFRYDDEAVAFTRAVLEKSPMVGLRGENHGRVSEEKRLRAGKRFHRDRLSVHVYVWRPAAGTAKDRTYPGVKGDYELQVDADPEAVSFPAGAGRAV